MHTPKANKGKCWIIHYGPMKLCSQHFTSRQFHCDMFDCVSKMSTKRENRCPWWTERNHRVPPKGTRNKAVSCNSGKIPRNWNPVEKHCSWATPNPLPSLNKVFSADSAWTQCFMRRCVCVLTGEKFWHDWILKNSAALQSNNCHLPGLMVKAQALAGEPEDSQRELHFYDFLRRLWRLRRPGCQRNPKCGHCTWQEKLILTLLIEEILF